MVDDQRSEEINPNDPDVREIRARAEERADRIAAGEKPWEDEEESSEAADAGFDAVDEPKDDTVEEVASPSTSPDVVENPEPVEVPDGE